MKKTFLITLFLFIAPFISIAQTDITIDSLIIQGKQQLKQAENTWEEADLLQARAYFERLLSEPSSKAWLVRYYIGLADYRLTSFHFSKQNQNQAKPFIDDGIDQLLQCIEAKPDFAEAHSLLSSMYGNKIAVSPFSAMTLGPKAGKEMDKAMALEPHNPRNYLIQAWSAYYTPKMFGGSKEKAKKHFEQAIACFDSFKVADPLLPNWGHEEAYAWLGVVQVKDGEFESAKANFEKALEINPEYAWVNYVLLPDLQKKMMAIK
ncbi:MAG: tetratricopeptide repeat protein [candidate division KSB1 bacterium]|nr:tetratricopeptide repeat protein [candidate division KSB1 bacterium]